MNRLEINLILLLHKSSLLSQNTFPHIVHCNILALDENLATGRPRHSTSQRRRQRSCILDIL